METIDNKISLDADYVDLETTMAIDMNVADTDTKARKDMIDLEAIEVDQETTDID